jgi:hypothetical protein
MKEALMTDHEPRKLSLELIKLPFLSTEDSKILLDRLRVGPEGWTLATIEKLIPHSASMNKSERVKTIAWFDLMFIEAWFQDNPDPPLEELALIRNILDKWLANHKRAGLRVPPPTKEEKALDRRIRRIAQRLIAKGQFTTNEEHME